MKIGLIVPGNLWFSPYVSIYTNALDKLNISYTVISWNRDSSDKPYGIQYTSSEQPTGAFAKLQEYLRYISYIKKNVKRCNFDKLIVFSPQLSILISFFLKRRYKNKYIIDYRDLSIEQKTYLMPIFKMALKNSYANVISSPGFVKYLPSGNNYIISHNFDIDLVMQSLSKSINDNYVYANNNVYNILTIGGIRDYQSNIEVVSSLANKIQYSLSFVGKGSAAPLIEKFANDNKINNINFVGYYPKEKEGDYINQCSFINIYYPKVNTHTTAISNRFYNALIYKKPMIVTANSTQGDYVEKYNLGIAINDCNNLCDDLENWVRNTDYMTFCKNCNDLLSTFVDDYKIFTDTIKEFTADNK